MSNFPRAALLLVALIGPTACGHSTETETPTTGTRVPLATPAQRIEETTTVTLPDGFTVVAEIADDPQETAIGMMGREEVPDGTGMLFVFPAPQHRSFWMKNCLTSLDIVWLAKTETGGRVVHVEHRVPPCPKDPCPSYVPGRRGSYVLELGPGQAARHAVAIGREVHFQLPGNSQQSP